MAKPRRQRKPKEPVRILTTFLYNILLAVSALVGFISYAAGISLEGVLVRVAIVMLLGLLAAYATDFALWYLLTCSRSKSDAELPPAQVEIESHARRVEPDPAQPALAGAAASGQA